MESAQEPGKGPEMKAEPLPWNHGHYFVGEPVTGD